MHNWFSTEESHGASFRTLHGNRFYFAVTSKTPRLSLSFFMGMKHMPHFHMQ